MAMRYVRRAHPFFARRFICTMVLPKPMAKRDKIILPKGLCECATNQNKEVREKLHFGPRTWYSHENISIEANEPATHTHSRPFTELNEKTKSTDEREKKNKRMRNNDFGSKTSGSRTNVLFSLNENVFVCVHCFDVGYFFFSLQ